VCAFEAALHQKCDEVHIRTHSTTHVAIAVFGKPDQYLIARVGVLSDDNSNGRTVVQRQQLEQFSAMREPRSPQTIRVLGSPNRKLRATSFQRVSKRFPALFTRSCDEPIFVMHG